MIWSLLLLAGLMQAQRPERAAVDGVPRASGDREGGSRGSVTERLPTAPGQRVLTRRETRLDTRITAQRLADTITAERAGASAGDRRDQGLIDGSDVERAMQLGSLAEDEQLPAIRRRRRGAAGSYDRD